MYFGYGLIEDSIGVDGGRAMSLPTRSRQCA
jgi:hypothetical protein